MHAAGPTGSFVKFSGGGGGAFGSSGTGAFGLAGGNGWLPVGGGPWGCGLAFGLAGGRGWLPAGGGLWGRGAAFGLAGGNSWLPAGEGAGPRAGGLGPTDLVRIGVGGFGVSAVVGNCAAVVRDGDAATGERASAVETPSSGDPHETTQTINTHENNCRVKYFKTASGGGSLRAVDPDPH